MLKVKDGVEFLVAPSGIAILQALKTVSKLLNIDLTITSGSDGAHSGPFDPHKRGEAYDIRSHDMQLDMKQKVLDMVNSELGPSFYGFLENPGESGEHFHFQIKRGTIFDIKEFLNS